MTIQKRFDFHNPAENQARREFADRCASLGSLVVGVVHDLRNPIAIATNGLDSARRALDAGELARAREAVALATEGVERARALMASVSAAVRPPDGNPVDLSAALDDALALAAPEIRQVARIVRDTEAGLLVALDKARLIQIALNLLVNAAQAIRGPRETNAIHVRARREGSSAILEIADTGRGIPEAARDRIFEPFFSTKPPGRGTGLGLFLAAEIARGAGGEITFRTGEGGTTFRVALPLHALALPGRAAMGSEPISAIVRRTGLVLVLDDDPDLREALSVALSGHRVDATDDPRYALARLRNIPYDAVICAVGLRGVSGFEVHRIACEQSPALASRFVFLANGQSGLEYAHARNLEILQKPAQIERIRSAVAARVTLPRGN